MQTATKTVSVLLRKDWFDCLHKSAAVGSIAANCLERAVNMNGILSGTRSEYCVQCTGEEIKAVLEIAHSHCRDAVTEISDGIRRFGG